MLADIIRGNTVRYRREAQLYVDGDRVASNWASYIVYIRDYRKKHAC